MTDIIGMSEKVIIEAFVKLEKAAQQIGHKIKIQLNTWKLCQTLLVERHNQ
jgi:uncharacterized protein YlaN (UPF0358 family)